MHEFIFKQLTFIRKLTLEEVEDISESQADIIPEGFDNNIRWHLGHIYTAQERLAFHITQEPLLLPDGYQDWFGKGTKPSDSQKDIPTLNDLRSILLNQPARIRETFENRLGEKVSSPFSTSSGLALETIAEILTFSLYHEGMHFDHIKTYKRLLNL